MKRMPCRARCVLGCASALGTTAVQAHSFGTTYILPMPLWMYAYGCTATLVVTFAVMIFFRRTFMPSGGARARTIEVSLSGPLRIISQWALGLLRAGAAACLLLSILAGLIGNTDPGRNIGMTLFWVVFLLGFVYLTVFLGDVYEWINPWKLAATGLERMGLDLSVPRALYPRHLGYWPAFWCYVALVWIELFMAPEPFTLSLILISYSVLTFAGIAVFGKAMWFRHADIFSVLFRLVGNLAPIEYPQAGVACDRNIRGGNIGLRPPFVGVLKDRPGHIALVLFVLFMLSSTAYDGMHDTVLWTALFWKTLLQLLQPVWGSDLARAQHLLMDWYLVYRQAGLVLFPFLYFGFYMFVLLWIKMLVRTAAPLRILALEFAPTLIPIAVAYHVTHYCTFLISQLRHLPWLVSDPFGFGWNLLGIRTAATQPALQMAVIWHAQIAVILVGHVVSVYLTHDIATRMFTSRRQVVVCQVPFLVLMVFYTIVGLWILSLPLGWSGR